MKIVAVGANGHLGSQAMSALRRDPSVTALAAMEGLSDGRSEVVVG